jgi:hypothetical protein
VTSNTPHADQCRLEFLTALTVEVTGHHVVTLCIMVKIFRRFRENSDLHIPVLKIWSVLVPLKRRQILCYYGLIFIGILRVYVTKEEVGKIS